VNNRPLQHNTASRTDRFQDNAELNSLLNELALLLKPVQSSLPYTTPTAPVGSIVGNPRSGTTIFLQWMASLGIFSYPTNLLTRFAYAPYVGALIQKMLFDPKFDYQGDFEDLKSEINFTSELGKSKGTLACNEFQHFFRNYMPNFEIECLDDDSLNLVNCNGISSGLASIEAGLGKPFITKANILQFNLAYFEKRIPSLFWIHIVRKPIFVMQSILQGREQYSGNLKTWLSAKPKEFELLTKMDVYHQIAGQVYYIEKAIRHGLRHIPKSKWIEIEYESFCASPEDTYQDLCRKYKQLGYDLPKEYRGQSSFGQRNTIRLPSKKIDALQAAYSQFENGLLEN
jgi:hypothetical protein